ncbi:MAG: beta-L-arabinofuranosidase domain-containing protein, partial [Planctomycetota bacterium]
FSEPYDLPNAIAYCETCAAIGMALWAHRMFLITGNARYLDVLELELYNGIPAGLSLSGDLFFYDNVLSSRGTRERVPWFDCSCCPTNIVRFVPQIPSMVISSDAVERAIFINVPMACEADVELATPQPTDAPKVKVTVESQYPWSGSVKVKVDPGAASPQRFKLHLRRPGWCVTDPQVTPLWSAAPDDEMTFNDETGFLVIDRTWESGDELQIELPMPVQRVHAHPLVHQNAGRVALKRGPVVFCLEEVDHPGLRVHNLVLPGHATLNATFDGSFLGVGSLRVAAEGLVSSIDIAPEGASAQGEPSTVSPAASVIGGGKDADSAAGGGGTSTMVAGTAVDTSSTSANGSPNGAVNITAIPYAFWNHRGKGEMVVWMLEDA